PTFLGAKNRANDRAAQSSLRNGFTNAKAVFTDQDKYPATATLVTNLTAAEPSLTFQTAASTGANVISVKVVDDNNLYLAGLSPSRDRPSSRVPSSWTSRQRWQRGDLRPPPSPSQEWSKGLVQVPQERHAAADKQDDG